MAHIIQTRTTRTNGHGLTDRELAKTRSQFYAQIRDFFNQANYVETETPILSTHLIPESAIEIFKTRLNHPHRESDELYLCPSPEVYMKTLIAEGIGDCYQITKVFRNAEHYSQRHLAEFTMLEWYGMNQNYLDNIQTTQSLLKTLAPQAHPDTRHYFETFSEITMSDLFEQTVGFALDQCETLEQFKAHANAAGLNEYTECSKTWEDLFEFIFVAHVERSIPSDRTVFVKDYPAQIPTTAKRTGNTYERWEFYMSGWEMANCYTEECRYQEMHDLFKKEEALKNTMITPHTVNYDYLDIFKDTFPPCSGVAMGLDRLFALFINAQSLDETSLFPFSEQLK